MTTTNKSDYPLELAVWLVHDDYDFVSEENYISATGLMKPLRHIILPPRIPPADRVPLDVEHLISSALGKTIHAGIEKAWKDGNHAVALRKLGYPISMIRRVLVNPTPEKLAETPDPIPVYIEQRTVRTITIQGQDFRVGGKFDMVCDGRVTDTKSTGVYTWIMDRNTENYILQLSIYRWLNPDKIKDDHGRVNYVFTDWNKLDAKIKAGQGYPPRRLMHKDVPLMSLEETEAWIRAKISLILMYQDSPEEGVPPCTKEELWISDTTYKYYADPAAAAKGGKSTKNFSDHGEALAHAAEKGKGIVKTVLGIPKRCGYCSAFPVCSQKDQYSHD